jgi:hypothetical protein
MPIVCATVAFGLGSGGWSCATAAGADAIARRTTREADVCLRMSSFSSVCHSFGRSEF